MQANGVTTRAFLDTDYDAVVALWQASDGVEVAEGDSREEIATCLQRNPNLSRVAESVGEIVGAVLCGHDAHRGFIYHLAVAQSHRGRGIGRQLIGECLVGLKACGIRRAIAMVAKDNNRGREFWKTIGFEPIDCADPIGIDLH